MAKHLLRWLGCILLASLFLTACRSKEKPKKKDNSKMLRDIDISIPGSFEPVSQFQFDSLAAPPFFSEYPNLSSIKSDWEKFYRQRQYSFAWVNAEGLSAAAQNLHNRINHLQDDGLDSSLPYRSEFNSLFNEASSVNEMNTGDSVLVRTEMMLTAQYFLYARNIYETLDEADLKKMGWNIERKDISFNDYLNRLLQSNNGEDIFAYEPVYQQYTLLKDYLRKYRQIQDKGGWGTVDTTVKKILPGDSTATVQQIKKRLFISGDFPDSISTSKYDPALATAIKRFRVRHGLKDTTLVDKPLVLEMNIPVEKRIEQILVNMERCRWLPVDPGPDYISVNIPDYRLSVYEKDSLQFMMDVVVGQTANKTVIFNDTLQTIAFSPYWHVPNSIYKKEIAGRPGYMRRNNMEFVNGQVRQRPGGNNALGKVKFLFPNSYNIYFHDTPAKDRFNYTNRSFSHGCIRLSEPRKLAVYLLRNEPKYTEAVIDSLMNRDKETQVQLKTRVPVYIIYMTAFVNAQTGQLQFRKDVYRQDQVVLDRIAKK